MLEDRVITEGELRDLIGEVVVGIAGSPDGTVVTNEVKVIMRLIKKYSKEDALLGVIADINRTIEDVEEQGIEIDEDIARHQDHALHAIYESTQESLLGMKV